MSIPLISGVLLEFEFASTCGAAELALRDREILVLCGIEGTDALECGVVFGQDACSVTPADEVPETHAFTDELLAALGLDVLGIDGDGTQAGACTHLVEAILGGDACRAGSEHADEFGVVEQGLGIAEDDQVVGIVEVNRSDR